MRQFIPRDRLPAPFAEGPSAPPDSPAPARPAATIVLARPAEPEPGLEVLLLRRPRSSGFVPGAYVFPGGRVDDGDADPGVAGRVEGLAAEGGTPGDAAGRRLGLPAADPPALAYWVAAVREAFEEVGILLARRDDGERVPTAGEEPRVAELRSALLDDRIAIADVVEALEARLDLSGVEYAAHWITPRAEPRRYDTRFFLAGMEERLDAAPHPGEVAEARWLVPEDALRIHREGELPMVFPTIRTLEELTGFPSPGAAVAAFAGREIPTRLPRLVRDEEGVTIELPEE